MQFVAISTFSASSEVRVPSFWDVCRKPIIESARRFFESGSDCQYVSVVSRHVHQRHLPF